MSLAVFVISFFSDCLHKFVELTDLLVCVTTPVVSNLRLQRIHSATALTAHFVYLGLVQLSTDPAVSLELLGVGLPFRQESNLIPDIVSFEAAQNNGGTRQEQTRHLRYEWGCQCSYAL